MDGLMHVASQPARHPVSRSFSFWQSMAENLVQTQGVDRHPATGHGIFHSTILPATRGSRQETSKLDAIEHPVAVSASQIPIPTARVVCPIHAVLTRLVEQNDECMRHRGPFPDYSQTSPLSCLYDHTHSAAGTRDATQCLWQTPSYSIEAMNQKIGTSQCPALSPSDRQAA